MDPPRGVARGRIAEGMAAGLLELRGHEVLDRNRRAGPGEVDLVTRDGDTLVFVEVRLRRRSAWVGPAGSIARRKWERLTGCARALAASGDFRWPGRRLRIDAVILELDGPVLRVEHLQNLRGPASRG